MDDAQLSHITEEPKELSGPAHQWEVQGLSRLLSAWPFPLSTPQSGSLSAICLSHHVLEGSPGQITGPESAEGRVEWMANPGWVLVR